MPELPGAEALFVGTRLSSDTRSKTPSMSSKRSHRSTVNRRPSRTVHVATSERKGLSALWPLLSDRRHRYGAFIASTQILHAQLALQPEGRGMFSCDANAFRV